MGRLTVRLPGTLHDQLRTLADYEGISLNQYIVYALTRQVTRAYQVQVVPEEERLRQEERYGALLERLGEATFSEVEDVLNAREGEGQVKGLPPAVVARLQERISEVQSG
jgi:hypothetical protein